MFPLACISSPPATSIEKRSHERLPDSRQGVALPLDRHLVANAQLALLDLGDLVAVGVLEHERLANTQSLAVDTERPPSLLVLDPVVVADGEQLLAHLKPFAVGLVVAAPQETHRATVWRTSRRRITPAG
jgi:hypothetical protein